MGPVTTPAPIGVAMVGCGNIGLKAHVPAYAATKALELRAVCDVDPERAQAAADMTGASVTTLDEILDDDSIEAVDVAVPTDAHAEVAGAALAAGKNVLVEKPITADMASALRLIEQARDRGRVLMVGHVRRFDARYLEIARVLASGTIGTPRYLRRAERQWLPFSGESWSWSAPGGGVLLDVGIHVADLVRWLLGEPTSVYATARSIRDEARSSGRGDHVFVTFGLGKGATAVGEVSWAHPGAFGTFYGALEVVGTDGILHLRDADGPLLVIGPDGVEHPRFGPLLSALPGAFPAQLEHFAAVLAGDEAPRQSADDAARSLRLCLDAARSIESRSVVEVG